MFLACFGLILYLYMSFSPKKSWRKIWWLLKKCLPLHSQSGSNAANKAKRNESDK